MERRWEVVKQCVSEVQVGAQITMVGELVSVNTFSMNVDMVLFDGTGTVKVQHWLSSDGDGVSSPWAFSDQPDACHRRHRCH